MEKQIVVIVGPTAVGKTEYTLQIAKAMDGEIISADSMQIYKFMDIGSAKPTKEELEMVPHHLVDEVDPRNHWTVAEYQALAKSYINDVFSCGKLPIVSGGTGLYVNSLLYDMDFSVVPKQNNLRKQLEKEALIYGNQWVHNRLKKLDSATAQRIHPNNLKRVIRAIEVWETSGDRIPDFSQSFVKTKDYQWILIGLTREREQLYQRINKRVDKLLEAGLVEEVERLLAMGLTEENSGMQGIGYKEVIGFLEGKYDKEEAIRLIKRNTRHYAKRQMTWFRRYPGIKWFHLSEDTKQEEAVHSILSYLNKKLE
ncbi:MAG: tRNA (adenosine(37)-N6)-dimethylallyltransferase MiaA [Eubacteriales bacterium]|nr:tRNA (adenosine(37)-N6)-dimethylallyltransferase MiaA [Eubacteriales bacterium]